MLNCLQGVKNTKLEREKYVYWKLECFRLKMLIYPDTCYREFRRKKENAKMSNCVNFKLAPFFWQEKNKTYNFFSSWFDKKYVSWLYNLRWRSNYVISTGMAVAVVHKKRNNSWCSHEPWNPLTHQMWKFFESQYEKFCVIITGLNFTEKSWNG